MLSQTRAILWAQFRTLLNFYSRGNTAGLWIAVVASAVWYGMVATGAVMLSVLFADPSKIVLIRRVLPQGLLAAFLYWQLVPMMLASAGATLDLKRLVVYPISRAQLFGIEVVLRFTTGVEMVILLVGASVGMLRNPAMPLWAVLAFLPFVTMNLFLSAGLRDLLSRMMAGRRTREVGVLLIVLLAALPQVLLLKGAPERLSGLLGYLSLRGWPWAATAKLAGGEFDSLALLFLAAWLALAYWFGRSQFERGFRVDPTAGTAVLAPVARAGEPWLERLYRLPGAVLPDPLGALVEKELRFLSRAPRFRLVFLMGFTFGLLVWLPMTLRQGNSESAFASNYLTFVSVYALMLLGEVSFWNTFGFDRAAAQLYYVTPVPIAMVLVGKNIASAIFVFLEITAVTLVCALFRMPISLGKLTESYLVALILALFLIAIGNLASIHYPRPVDPSKSWRRSAAGKMQAMLMFAYPVLSFPIFLAYMARYAFESDIAFYGMLCFAAALGMTVYGVALDSSVRAAESHKDAIVTALSQGEGPVSG
jgi:ABC-2 type transport system permease protein